MINIFELVENGEIDKYKDAAKITENRIPKYYNVCTYGDNVKFFMDKGKYIEKRLELVINELHERGLLDDEAK